MGIVSRLWQPTRVVDGLWQINVHVDHTVSDPTPRHFAVLSGLLIEDPNVYTRPWTISMPLYRRLEPAMQLGEFKCEEFVGDLMYGKYRTPVPVR